jgi:glutaredoxin 3
MAQVTIYTTRFCPFCVQAKHLLDQKEVSYTEIAVDGNPSLRAEMTQKSGGHTVPQIFIDDKPIGGCDDLYALHSQGKLDDLLN